MRDDAYTNPATIRATYAARGKNRNLNVAKAESLGIKATQISPPQAVNGGGSGGSGSVAGAGLIDPTLQTQGGDTYGGTTYDGTTYEGTTYKQEPIDGGAGIVI